jgi:mobilization protein NikA
MAEKTVMLSVRVRPADRAVIAARAREARLSQSEYVTRTVLQMPTEGLKARFEAIERRLYQLEHMPR